MAASPWLKKLLQKAIIKRAKLVKQLKPACHQPCLRSAPPTSKECDAIHHLTGQSQLNGLVGRPEPSGQHLQSTEQHKSEPQCDEWLLYTEPKCDIWLYTHTQQATAGPLEKHSSRSTLGDAAFCVIARLMCLGWSAFCVVCILSSAWPKKVFWKLLQALLGISVLTWPLACALA